MFIINTFKFITVFRSISCSFDVPYAADQIGRIGTGMYNSLWSSSRTLSKKSHWSIPHSVKSMRAAASLSDHWFAINICPRGWLRLDQCHGTLTAEICLDSVINKQRLFKSSKESNKSRIMYHSMLSWQWNTFLADTRGYEYLAIMVKAWQGILQFLHIIFGDDILT